MLKTYTFPQFDYRKSEEQSSGSPVRHPVVIVGAGPVGLTQALDLAFRGVPTVVLDDNNTVSVGSRAVCYAKRTLEVWDRLGIGQACVDQDLDVGRHRRLRQVEVFRNLVDVPGAVPGQMFQHPGADLAGKTAQNVLTFQGVNDENLIGHGVSRSGMTV